MENYILLSVALGGLYTIAKQESTKSQVKESFTSKQSERMPVVSSISNTASTSGDSFSLTGEQINVNEFSHNNMVPFFGAKHTGKDTLNDFQSDSILDNMVGSGSNSQRKTSQPPLFKPRENLNWTHGAPNNSEFFKDRMTSNLSQRKHNDKPWDSINVGPGLTNNFSQEGTHGFNSGLMSREQWKPKTVDETRTINNPKLSYDLDWTGPPSTQVQTLSQHSKVEKNKPDTYFDHGPNRYFTNASIKNQSMVPQHINPELNRDSTSVEYTGIPSSGGFSKASIANQNFEPPKKDHVFGEFIGAPAPLHTKLNDQSKSYSNHNTKRAKHNFSGFGNIQGITNMMGGVSEIVDTLNPTRKELIVENMRQNGYIAKVGAGGQPVYDPHDIPKSTLRQNTNYSTADNNIMVTGDMNDIIPNDIVMSDTHRSTTTSYRVSPATSSFGAKPTLNNQRNNNNKISTAWTPAGNTSLFNNTINHNTNNVMEKQLQLNRQNVPDRIKDVMPNQQQIGVVRMPTDHVQSTNERLDSTILDAFKENPYTHNIKNAL